MQLNEWVYYKIPVSRMNEIKEIFHYLIGMHYIVRSPLNKCQEIVFSKSSMSILYWATKRTAGHNYYTTTLTLKLLALYIHNKNVHNAAMAY